MTYSEVCRFAKILNLPVKDFLFSKKLGMLNNTKLDLVTLTRTDFCLGIDVSNAGSEWQWSNTLEATLSRYNPNRLKLEKATMHHFRIYDVDVMYRDYFIIESNDNFENLYGYRPRFIVNKPRKMPHL